MTTAVAELPHSCLSLPSRRQLEGALSRTAKRAFLRDAGASPHRQARRRSRERRLCLLGSRLAAPPVEPEDEADRRVDRSVDAGRVQVTRARPAGVVAKDEAGLRVQ